MNKEELIAAVANNGGLTKKDSEKAVNAFVESFKETLTKKEKIQLIGFGTFEVRHRDARTGRNPQTGGELKIPATDVPVFKPGLRLKEAVNKNKKKKAK